MSNETIHDGRRPPSRPALPPAAPRGRGRTVAMVVVAVVVSLGAGYATATRLDSSKPHATTATATTARTSTVAGATQQTRAGTLAAVPPPASTASPSVPAPPVSPATTPATGAPAPATTPAAATSFDAPIPSGWREREFAVALPQAGYLESRWSDPHDPRSYVVIDWRDGDPQRPGDAAATLRAGAASQPDYRELRFQATRGGGWIWVYTAPDKRGRKTAQIDLLTHRCGVLFAVLGVTTTKRFAALQRTFIAISEGIRIKARRC
jgi:hypothetical protein